MTRQTTLLDPKPPEYQIPLTPEDRPATAGDYVNALDAHETALAAIPPAPEQPPMLMEFRKGFMSMTVPNMVQALTEYTDWRKAFRKWLLSIMVEGIHYGWAVGFAPKWCLLDGKDCDEESAQASKTYSSKNQKWTITPIAEFLPKRNLLLAGADLVCDALWVRDAYEADMDTWQQLGSAPGKIVKRCKLYSKITGEFIGEGSGGRTEGEKFMGLNSSIKMAENSAKRCAVLNAFGLRDLFTQDMEPGGDNGPEKRPSPEANKDAPTAQPRGERVTAEQIKSLLERWRKCENPAAQTEADWFLYVRECCHRPEMQVRKPSDWSVADYDALNEALGRRGA